MKLSLFGKKLTKKSGILELMEDLGKSFKSKQKVYMLGGGNPAHITDMQKIYRQNMQQILDNQNQFEALIGNYDIPQGNEEFLNEFAGFLQKQFGFEVTKDNIAVTNGSQSGFFILFNLLAGKMADGKDKKILFPLVPEYIGYEDQAIADDMLVSCRPKIDIIDRHSYKYRIDFDNLKITDDIAAICLSRPTNPTGNVITDQEISRLRKIAQQNNIPLIIDNAYGAPFPNALFVDSKLTWDKNTILTMSLSKCGLPSSRTGIIVADKALIKAISAANAIISLAVGGFGQALMGPLLKDGKIVNICDQIIKPYYLDKSLHSQQLIKKYFDDSLPYYLHKNEGSFFLWMWFKDLPITTKELYQRLKKENVIIVPGHYFFAGIKDQSWRHPFECIRINYGAAGKEDFEHAIKIIANQVKKAYYDKVKIQNNR